jgi:hypothetical protein
MAPPVLSTTERPEFGPKRRRNGVHAVKKVPAPSGDGPADESPIVRDLRKLVDASRKLREEVCALLIHRPRADLRAAVDAQQRRRGGHPEGTTSASERVQKKRA